MKLSTLNCENCNKDFSFPERHLKIKQKHKNNFCSAKCRIDFNKAKFDSRKCIVCTKDFSVKSYLKTKCCSRKCADKIAKPKTKFLYCKCCNLNIKKAHIVRNVKTKTEVDIKNLTINYPMKSL